MYVAYTSTPASTSREVGLFANSRTFPEAFSDVVGSPKAPKMQSLIADGRVLVESGTLDASTTNCFIFVAKDRQTLKDGLKACPQEIKISGRGKQLGFFGRSYDFEKFGGWLRQRQRSAKQWDRMNEDQRCGVPKKHLEAFFNRFRLTERGYFIFVARGFVLGDVAEVTKMIGSEISLPGLGSMMSDRMTRGQAVDTLMNDLLVA